MSQTLSAFVHSLRHETGNILDVELRPTESGALFPSFEAGAHIDLHLPNGLVRSYSLINPLERPERYRVAVLLAPDSRGGSRFVHEQLRVGTQIAISPPRNLFRLQEDAPHSFLLAGGIGITPLYAMLQRLTQLGRSVDLVVCARARAQAAFLGDAHALAGPGVRIQEHMDDEAGTPPDLQTLLGAQPAGTHFYCCGPAAMIQAFESTCASLGHEHVHVERFASAPSAGAVVATAAYQLCLRRSGRTLDVDPAQPLLDTVLAAGIDVPFSCREGICGACETPVLGGAVTHRDSVLSVADQRANRSMMLCVSHGCGPLLELDL